MWLVHKGKTKPGTEKIVLNQQLHFMHAERFLPSYTTTRRDAEMITLSQLNSCYAGGRAHENTPAQTCLSLKFKQHVKAFPVKPVVVRLNGAAEARGGVNRNDTKGDHRWLHRLFLKVKPFGHSGIFLAHWMLRRWAIKRISPLHL